MMMNELTVMEKDDQLVVSSIEVAEMTGKDHKNLMRDIKGYISTLEDSSNLSAPNFFVEGSYVSSQNKILPCFFLTRQGCDMVANKMTGKKGVLFTATYVDRFHAMENQLKQQLQPKLPATYKEALLALIEAEEVKEQLELENKQKDAVIQEQKPMVVYAEQTIESDTSIDMAMMANLATKRGYRIGRNDLFAKLRKWEVLKDNNTPYQQFMNVGYFEVIQVPVKSGGRVPKTLVTPKGQIYIVNRLLKEIDGLEAFKVLGLI